MSCYKQCSFFFALPVVLHTVLQSNTVVGSTSLSKSTVLDICSACHFHSLYKGTAYFIVFFQYMRPSGYTVGIRWTSGISLILQLHPQGSPMMRPSFHQFKTVSVNSSESTLPQVKCHTCSKRS